MRCELTDIPNPEEVRSLVCKAAFDGDGTTVADVLIGVGIPLMFCIFFSIWVVVYWRSRRR